MRGFFKISLFILISVFSIHLVSALCLDSDSGRNYTRYGFVNFSSSVNSYCVFNDMCYNTRILKEYYCSNNTVRYIYYNCGTAGCSNGKCNVTNTPNPAPQTFCTPNAIKSGTQCLACNAFGSAYIQNNSKCSSTQSCNSIGQCIDNNPISTGAKFYVDGVVGNDNNPGNITSPFKTIQKAADIVNPGDTVIIRDGIYTDSNNDNIGVWLTRGGTPGNYITFKAENKWKAILDGQKKASFGFATADLVNYIIIDGFEIRNFLDSGVIINENNTGIIVRQNHIHDIGRIQSYSEYGISCIDIGSRASFIKVEKNLIHTCGRLNPNTNPPAPESSCTTPSDYTMEGVSYPNFVACYNHDHGIYIRGDNINVSNNIFYDNKAGWGIQVYNEGKWKEHIYIDGNTFADPNPKRVGHVLVSSYSNDVVIQNNIFYNPTNEALDLPDPCDPTLTNLVVRNNLANVNIATSSPICSSYTFSNNYLSQDPKFVDPSSRNYHLQAGSPAIDKGISSAVKDDFDGNARPQGAAPDIGAYEVR